MKTITLLLLFASSAFAGDIVSCNKGQATVNQTVTYSRGTCYEATGFYLDCDEIYTKTKFEWEENRIKFTVSGLDEKLVLIPSEEKAPENCTVDWERLKIFNSPLDIIYLQEEDDQIITSNELTAVLDSFENLNEGYLSLYVGQSHLEGTEFLKRLDKHIRLVADTMAPYGQLKYYVYASNNRELAVIQWPSKEAMDFAFEREGQIIWDDANEFLTGLVWEKLDHLPGGKITQGFIDLNISRKE